MATKLDDWEITFEMLNRNAKKKNQKKKMAVKPDKNEKKIREEPLEFEIWIQQPQQLQLQHRSYNNNNINVNSISGNPFK